MQDIEFTVEKINFGCCRLDQGKELAKAAIKIAVDMVREN